MVLRKALSVALCSSLLITSAPAALAGTLNSTNTIQPAGYTQNLPDPTNLQSKLMMIEEVVYGQYQTGPILTQIKNLEVEFYGKPAPNNVPIDKRINELYKLLFDNTVRPSVITQLNGIEWFLSRRVSNNSLLQRITALDNKIYGSPQQGTLQQRMNRLAVLAYGSSSQTPLVHTTIPADTLIKIKLVTPLNSETSKVGDVVKYQAAEDIVNDGILIIPAGAPGVGVVTKVKPAKNFGRNGEVDVNFQQIQTFDGTMVPTILGDKAKMEIKNLAYAGAASVASMALLGPIGIVGGIFVHGKNVDLPEGTESFIQTKTAKEIFGIHTQLSDNLVINTAAQEEEPASELAATTEEATDTDGSTTLTPANSDAAPEATVASTKAKVENKLTTKVTKTETTAKKSAKNNIYDYEY